MFLNRYIYLDSISRLKDVSSMKARGVYFLTSCSACSQVHNCNWIQKALSVNILKTHHSTPPGIIVEAIKKFFLFIDLISISFLDFNIFSLIFLLDLYCLKTIASFDLKCFHSTIQSL